VFLHFYSNQPNKRATWLSLISRAQSTLLAPLASSNKNFKCGFFKVLVEKDGRKYFYDGDKPKFPFYLINTPLKYNSLSRYSMIVDDLETYHFLMIYLESFLLKAFSVSICLLRLKRTSSVCFLFGYTFFY